MADRQYVPGQVLLLAGTALHVGAVFPPYLGAAQPITSNPGELAEYACWSVCWACAALLATRPTTVPGAVALSVGLGAFEAGVLVSDTASSFISTSGASPGHWLALAGLLCGEAGALALAGAAPAGGGLQWGRLELGPRGRSVTSSGIGVGALAVVAYLAHWVDGVSPAYAGDAFSLSPPVAAGVVVSAAAMVGTVLAACLWRPGALAACAGLGALVGLVSQVLAAPLDLGSVPQQEVLPGQSPHLDLWWALDVVAAIYLVIVASSALAAYARSLRAPATSGGRVAPEGAEEGRAAAEEGREETWPGQHHWPRHPHQGD